MASLTWREEIAYGRKMYDILDEMRKKDVHIDNVSREHNSDFYDKLHSLKAEHGDSLAETIGSVLLWNIGGLISGPRRCIKAAKYHS